MNRLLKKFIATTLCFTLLTAHVKASAPQSPPHPVYPVFLNKISPAQGSVREIFDPSIQNGRPFIFIIQDVHQNLEAQKNIASILESWSGYALSIGVEAAFDDFDFRPFHRLGEENILRQTADRFLESHQIAAPSYAGILSRTNLSFYGVDDFDHYKANVRAYLNADAVKRDALQRLKNARAELLSKKIPALNSDLQKFNALSDGYDNGSISMGTYVEKINDLFHETGKGDPPDPDLVLSRFLAAAAMEKKMDFSRIERERQRLVEKLAKRLAPAELKTLLTKSLSYRSGKITHARYYRDIRSLLEENRVSFKSAPAFEDYLRYVLLTDGIKPEPLLRAIAGLETALADRLCKNETERAVLDEARQLRLTRKLVDFALAPDEWADYRRLGEHRRPFFAADLTPFENFYREADARSIKMADKLGRQNGPVAAVVVGGFHTAELTALLKKNGTPYAVIQPALTRVSDEPGSSYLSVFAREKAAVERLFEGEKLFLGIFTTAVGSRFARTTMERMLARTAAELHVSGRALPGDYGIEGREDGLLVTLGNRKRYFVPRAASVAGIHEVPRPPSPVFLARVATVTAGKIFFRTAAIFLSAFLFTAPALPVESQFFLSLLTGILLLAPAGLIAVAFAPAWELPQTLRDFKKFRDFQEGKLKDEEETTAFRESHFPENEEERGQLQGGIDFIRRWSYLAFRHGWTALALAQLLAHTAANANALWRGTAVMAQKKLPSKALSPVQEAQEEEKEREWRTLETTLRRKYERVIGPNFSAALTLFREQTKSPYKTELAMQDYIVVIRQARDWKQSPPAPLDFWRTYSRSGLAGAYAPLFLMKHAAFFLKARKWGLDQSAFERLTVSAYREKGTLQSWVARMTEDYYLFHPLYDSLKDHFQEDPVFKETASPAENFEAVFRSASKKMASFDEVRLLVGTYCLVKKSAKEMGSRAQHWTFEEFWAVYNAAGRRMVELERAVAKETELFRELESVVSDSQVLETAHLFPGIQAAVGPEKDLGVLAELVKPWLLAGQLRSLDSNRKKPGALIIEARNIAFARLCIENPVEAAGRLILDTETEAIAIEPQSPHNSTFEAGHQALKNEEALVDEIRIRIEDAYHRLKKQGKTAAYALFIKALLRDINNPTIRAHARAVGLKAVKYFITNESPVIEPGPVIAEFATKGRVLQHGVALGVFTQRPASHQTIVAQLRSPYFSNNPFLSYLLISKYGKLPLILKEVAINPSLPDETRFYAALLYGALPDRPFNQVDYQAILTSLQDRFGPFLRNTIAKNDPELFTTLMTDPLINDELMKIHGVATLMWMHKRQNLEIRTLRRISADIVAGNIGYEYANCTATYLIGTQSLNGKKKSVALFLSMLVHEHQHNILWLKHKYEFAKLEMTSKSAHELACDVAANEFLDAMAQPADIVTAMDHLSYKRHKDAVKKRGYTSGEEHEAARSQLFIVLETLELMKTPVRWPILFTSLMSVLGSATAKQLEFEEIVKRMLQIYKGAVAADINAVKPEPPVDPAKKRVAVMDLSVVRQVLMGLAVALLFWFGLATPAAKADAPAVRHTVRSSLVAGNVHRNTAQGAVRDFIAVQKSVLPVENLGVRLGLTRVDGELRTLPLNDKDDVAMLTAAVAFYSKEAQQPVDADLQTPDNVRVAIPGRDVSSDDDLLALGKNLAAAHPGVTVVVGVEPASAKRLNNKVPAGGFLHFVSKNDAGEFEAEKLAARAGLRVKDAPRIRVEVAYNADVSDELISMFEKLKKYHAALLILLIGTAVSLALPSGGLSNFTRTRRAALESA